MAILKTRPRVRLLVPSEITPGTTFLATVLLECKRPVDVDLVEVRFVGMEQWRLGSGKQQVRRQAPIVVAEARASGPRTLPAGRTELPVRIPVPEDALGAYRGKAGWVEYEAVVHVSVPWWPDRRAPFEIKVLPPPVASPVERAPRVFSSRPSGPEPGQPHLELSLAHDWSRQGEVVSGAFALSNVGTVRYSRVRLGLLGTELLFDGQALRGRREHQRYQIELDVERAGEGEMIPFSFRVPEEAVPSFGRAPRPHGAPGLTGMVWELEAEVSVRWGRDLELRVPFELLPRSPRARDAPPRIAPPAVGSDRLRALWTEVGARHGLAYEEQTLVARVGETTLTVARDHQGREGVHLVAEVRYPPLGLELKAEPVKGLGLFAGGMSVGDPAWDRAHRFVARDEAQGAAFVRPLLPTLSGVVLRGLDDRGLTVALRDPGQSRHHLEPFVVGAVHLLVTLERLRQEVPPPTGLADAVPAWRALAGRLGATLERGPMRISGQLSSLGATVSALFDRQGRAAGTRLFVSPPSPLDAEHALLARADQAGATLDARLRGEARELARTLLAEVEVLSIAPEGVAVELRERLGVPGPGSLDAARAEQLLGRLARLVEVLRGKEGPYR